MTIPYPQLVLKTILTEPIEMYVRSDGSDDNTGFVNSSGGAKLTLQSAINDVCNKIEQRGNLITIKLMTDGSFSGFSMIMPTGSTQFIVPNGPIRIEGDSGDWSARKITSGSIYPAASIGIGSGATITFANLQVDANDPAYMGIILAGTGSNLLFDGTVGFVNYSYTACLGVGLSKFTFAGNVVFENSLGGISGFALFDGTICDFEPVTVTHIGDVAYQDAFFSLTTRSTLTYAISSLVGAPNSIAYRADLGSIISDYSGIPGSTGIVDSATYAVYKAGF